MQINTLLHVLLNNLEVVYVTMKQVYCNVTFKKHKQI